MVLEHSSEAEIALFDEYENELAMELHAGQTYCPLLSVTYSSPGSRAHMAIDSNLILQKLHIDIHTTCIHG